MEFKASILISSFNRINLFRRTLWAIANRKPSIPFEVVVADEGSTDDIHSLLKEFSSCFYWTLVKVDITKFEEKIGLKKFHNNPSLTNNIAFKFSGGEYVFLQGNEVIPWSNCYDKMIEDYPKHTKYGLVMSTTYDIQRPYIDVLDKYGQNLTQGIVDSCVKWPLQSKHYRSDVTNYISLCERGLWQGINGYDERYVGGISSDDSDFVRRCRTLPDFEQVISEAISLHQFHNGKTCYYNPPVNVITKERWDEGVKLNHAIYHAWDGSAQNKQNWPWGELGVVEVISNWRKNA